MATRLELSLLAALTLTTAANAAERCRVTDPTGTPLNVRSSPNGKIVGTIENGQSVVVLDRSQSNGRPWTYIGDNEDNDRPIGWVFREFVSCSRPKIENSSGPCTAPRLMQGMEYRAARKLALSAGFQAPRISAYGYSPKDDKVITECNGDVELCNRYPEIESCGSGNCAMSLTDAYGNALRIVTYGEISDGSASVTSFNIRCKQ